MICGSTYNLRKWQSRGRILIFFPTQGFKEMQSAMEMHFLFFYVQLTIFVKMFHSEIRKKDECKRYRLSVLWF
jgi:hypothetical protein